MAEFTTIEEVIEYTKKNLNSIQEEFDKYQNYQINNPDYVFEVIETLKKKKIKPLPTFDEMITFKTGYLIDNESKVYAQIKNRNSLFIARGPEVLLFYKVEKGLFNKQCKEELELGELDSLGRIVSGSDLIISSLQFDFQKFLEDYYSLNN